MSNNMLAFLILTASRVPVTLFLLHKVLIKNHENHFFSFKVELSYRVSKKEKILHISFPAIRVNIFSEGEKCASHAKKFN